MIKGLQVLYIEDDELVRRASVQSLQLAGFEVVGHASVESAAKLINAEFSGVIVSDIRLPGASGLDLLAQCRERAPDVPIILVTGHGDISMAVQAMRDGAYDFIEKPFPSERLIETVRRALERRTLVLENLALRRELAEQGTLAPRIIGRSLAIEQVRKLIANVAPTDASVLINGDTGAGKELIARSLHELSPRRDKPFLAVNCGALPEPMFESEMFGYEPGAFTGAAKRRIGKLEHASGGTLFLDEIESMPLALQVKLLRVLQDGVLERLGSNQPIRVDCRIIAADFCGFPVRTVTCGTSLKPSASAARPLAGFCIRGRSVFERAMTRPRLPAVGHQDLRRAGCLPTVRISRRFDDAARSQPKSGS